MRLAVLVIPLLLATACATTAKYEAKLRTWVGHDANSLIASWGPPTDEYLMPGGGLVLTYRRGNGAVAMPVGNMVYATNVYCETTFTTDPEGTIIHWRWRGNACKSE